VTRWPGQSSHRPLLSLDRAESKTPPAELKDFRPKTNIEQIGSKMKKENIFFFMYILAKFKCPIQIFLQEEGIINDTGKCENYPLLWPSAFTANYAQTLHC
jgi:hypothetical protein